jgi:hypothetical protein
MLIEEKMHSVDLHFMYSEEIRRLYPQRYNKEIRIELINLCKSMIAISTDAAKMMKAGGYILFVHEQRLKESLRRSLESMAGFADAENMMIESQAKAREAYIEKPSDILPVHIGYDKLFQLYLDEYDFDEAETILEKANSEGWAGDWGKRFDKLERARKKLLY